MTPEAQRIAIAEACGWKFYQREGAAMELWHGPQGEVRDGYELPNYVYNLNAMHEAEKVLTDEQKKKYANILWDIGNGFETDLDPYIGTYFEVGLYTIAAMVCATASQRAEAFLKTLNLWVPSPQEREEVRG